MDKDVHPYKQRKDTCAIACMLMVLEYYKVIEKANWYDERRLYRIYGSKYMIGTPFSALAFYMAKNGLETTIYHENKELFKNDQGTINSDNFEDYTPMYNYQVTDTEGRIADMAILIIRNLSGGSLRTYIYDCDRGGENYCMTKNGDEVRFHIGMDNSGSMINGAAESRDGLVGTPLKLEGFVEADANFCVVSSDSRWAGGTRNIRLQAGGTNTGAVQIVNQDSNDNLCRGL